MNQAYKEFIQYSLDESRSLPDCTETIDWQAFMQFCFQHSIIGVVFAGLERANIRIPQNVLFVWLSYVETIKNQNQIVDKRVIDITKWFEKKSFRSIILKGQANGLMYPKPELRCPDDIDVWVYAQETELINLVIRNFPKSKYTFHHIEMPIFNDISVEVHYRPSFLINWKKGQIVT